MKSFPPDFPEDENRPDEGVQEVLGEMTDRPPRKAATSEGAESEWPKKTGQITRDVYRD